MTFLLGLILGLYLGGAAIVFAFTAPGGRALALAAALLWPALILRGGLNERQI